MKRRAVFFIVFWIFSGLPHLSGQPSFPPDFAAALPFRQAPADSADAYTVLPGWEMSIEEMIQCGGTNREPLGGDSLTYSSFIEIGGKTYQWDLPSKGHRKDFFQLGIHFKCPTWHVIEDDVCRLTIYSFTRISSWRNSQTHWLKCTN